MITTITYWNSVKTFPFSLEYLGKRNCEKGIIWKLQGNREDYSFKLIKAGIGDILPEKKTQLGNKFQLENTFNKNQSTNNN